MKKILLTLIALFSLTGSYAQFSDDSRENLKMLAEATNDNLPITVSPGYTFDRITYSKTFNTLYMDYNVSPELYKEITGSDMSELKQGVIQGLETDNSAFMVDVILKAGANVEARYYKWGTREFITIPVSISEIREIASGHSAQAAPQQLLEKSVENTNAECPVDWGNGLTLLEMKIVNGYLYYVVKYDEAQVTAEQLASQKDVMKASMIEAFKSSGGDEMHKYAAKSGYGIKIEYRGAKTGYRFFIVFFPAEVKDWTSV